MRSIIAWPLQRSGIGHIELHRRVGERAGEIAIALVAGWLSLGPRNRASLSWCGARIFRRSIVFHVDEIGGCLASSKLSATTKATGSRSALLAPR